MTGMPKIISPTSRRFCKCLVFSPPGHGKTHLLGTAQDDPRTYPMLLLDFEGGTSTLVGRDIDIIEIRKWEDYNDSYAFLKNSAEAKKYKSVGIDSISETHIFALMAQLNSPEKNRRIPDLLEQGDYGIALVQMRKLLRSFRDLPIHFFATSLAKDDTDPKEGTIKKPALAGAMSDEAPGIFDVVAYLSLASYTPEGAQEAETHRLLIYQNYPKLRTKVRVPQNLVAPNEVWDPTVGIILDTLGYPSIEELTQEEMI